MFVRAYDAHTKEYYKSMVYALVDPGIREQAVVYHPVLDSFVLLHHLNAGNPDLVGYACIQPDRTGWQEADPAFSARLKSAPTRDRGAEPLTRLLGYPEVVGSPGFLQALLSTGFVPREQAGIPLREPADLQTWTYVRTQADADELMRRFGGFRGAALVRLYYKENTGTRQLTARFEEADHFGAIDLCFEGTLALHLQRVGENRSHQFACASLLVREETVFWADAELPVEDSTVPDNYVKALNLKWRKVRRIRKKFPGRPADAPATL